MRVALILFGLFVCLFQFGNATYSAETIRAEGATVLLDLRPVDPRALLIGDYMALGYAAANELSAVEDRPEEGVVILRIDADGVGHFDRIDAGETIAENEQRLRYRDRGNSFFRRPDFGGSRYYFQSGSGERYADARYGVFKVMPDGRAILSGLADEQRNIIAVAGQKKAP